MMIHSNIPSIPSSEEIWHSQYPDKDGIQYQQPYYEYQQPQHHHQNQYYQQKQPIGIFPERPQNREEWKVAGRVREGWKVSSTPQFSKPLPQEPPMPPPRRSFAAQQQQQFDYWYYEQQQPPPPPQPLPQRQHQQPAYGYYLDEAYETDQSSAGGETWTLVDADPPTPPAQENPAAAEKKSKDAIVDTTKRQITVQSINVEYKVWIDIDTTETGLTLANKIHKIATFRTRKIVSITTTAGRTIPLDHRPVFGSWMEMDDFKNGEEWKVEWCELDRGFVDRFVSRFVQVSSSSRRK